MERRINVLLIGLIVLDATIAAAAFASPSLWYSIIHGAAYVDPQGLLRRTAANWGAFALIQVAALFQWRVKPYWLLIVAGARLSDMFTDWSYLYFCHDITRFGRLALLAASPLNALIGWYLVRTYLRLEER
jgi:hypothetical protein